MRKSLVTFCSNEDVFLLKAKRVYYCGNQIPKFLLAFACTYLENSIRIYNIKIDAHKLKCSKSKLWKKI